MYAIEAIFSRTEYVNGRAKFLGLELIQASTKVNARLRRNRHIALFSTRALANNLMGQCNPATHALAYRIRNRLFIAFDATTVARTIKDRKE